MTNNRKENTQEFVFWEEFTNPEERGDLDDLIFAYDEYRGPSER
jgi:hypothetical protein